MGGQKCSIACTFGYLPLLMPLLSTILYPEMNANSKTYTRHKTAIAAHTASSIVLYLQYYYTILPRSIIRTTNIESIFWRGSNVTSGSSFALSKSSLHCICYILQTHYVVINGWMHNNIRVSKLSLHYVAKKGQVPRVVSKWPIVNNKSLLDNAPNYLPSWVHYPKGNCTFFE